MTAPGNTVAVSVRSELARDVLPAIVAMLAARAECPLDRLEEALLLTDAVAAHAPGRSQDDLLRVTISVNGDGLAMAVDGLVPDGAAGLLADATLPEVGAVLERLADELRTEPGDAGERLILQLHYTAPETGTVNNGR